MDTTERDDTTLPGRDRRARKTIKLGDTRVIKRAVALKRATWLRDEGVTQRITRKRER